MLQFTSKQYQCTAVHIDQSNDYYNFFSVDSHVSNLIDAYYKNNKCNRHRQFILGLN